MNKKYGEFIKKALHIFFIDLRYREGIDENK